MQKGKSVRNPFGIELPYQLSTADLEYLVRHLRAGLITKEEKYELYMSHVRLAIRIAGSYAWLAPHLIHDLIQAAMLAIAEALASAPEKLHDNNITPYITTRIRGALHDEIAAQFIMPGRTYRHKNKNKNDAGRIRAPLYEKLDTEKAYAPPTVTVDVLDALEYCIDDDSNLKRREYKRVILRLKSSGYTNAEIASIIEISETYVQSMLADIKKSFQIINQKE